MYKILQYPDLGLRRKAIPVENIKDKRIQEIIDGMFATLYNTPNCAGLSATQLDIDEPPMITVIDESANNQQSICLINPEIISREGRAKYSEGCMSIFPDHIQAEVERDDKIVFRAYDRRAELLEVAAEGIFSICVQHEIDHLNGVLYIDRLGSLKRKMVERKIAKIIRDIERQ